MSEMIDRVAKAILKAGDSVDEWEDIGPFWQGVYRKEARAAIEAMREPTEAMGAAGLMASSHDPLSGHEKMTSDEAEQIGWTDRLRANPSRWEMPVWRAMIDAALAPPVEAKSEVEG